MAKALSKPESNLKKLTKSPIPMNFVKKHNATWNHQDWLDFLDYLKEKNYFPIDTDKVGLLLEEKKAQYIALKNKQHSERAYCISTDHCPVPSGRCKGICIAVIMERKPLIALTMGDPAGIGPEIIVRMLAAHPEFQDGADIVVYGCPEVIEDAAKRFLPGQDFRYPVRATGSMKIGGFHFGELSAQCGREAYEAVCAAARDALAEKVDAVVTAPVNKAAVNLAGIPFTGHTELIAGICGTDDFAMMQSAGNLRVAFVTTHIALKDVPKFATRERIIKTTRLLENAIRAEGITEPKSGIAAINPHAGENGNMGTEDELVTKPAVMHMQEMGMKVEGPFPPDTLFIKSTLDRFDGIISMYHDQGHIPFKMLAFDRGVNSTLGLPVIRTSVDHGTAFEIAGKGIADTGSFAAAFQIALKRARARLERQ